MVKVWLSIVLGCLCLLWETGAAPLSSLSRINAIANLHLRVDPTLISGPRARSSARLREQSLAHCSRGPVFWCESVGNAHLCKTFGYCLFHVWTNDTTGPAFEAQMRALAAIAKRSTQRRLRRASDHREKLDLGNNKLPGLPPAGLALDEHEQCELCLFTFKNNLAFFEQKSLQQPIRSWVDWIEENCNELHVHQSDSDTNLDSNPDESDSNIPSDGEKVDATPSNPLCALAQDTNKHLDFVFGKMLELMRPEIACNTNPNDESRCGAYDAAMFDHPEIELEEGKDRVYLGVHPGTLPCDLCKKTVELANIHWRNVLDNTESTSDTEKICKSAVEQQDYEDYEDYADSVDDCVDFFANRSYQLYMHLLHRDEELTCKSLGLCDGNTFKVSESGDKMSANHTFNCFISFIINLFSSTLRNHKEKFLILS